MDVDYKSTRPGSYLWVVTTFIEVQDIWGFDHSRQTPKRANGLLGEIIFMCDEVSDSVNYHAHDWLSILPVTHDQFHLLLPFSSLSLVLQENINEMYGFDRVCYVMREVLLY